MASTEQFVRDVTGFDAGRDDWMKDAACKGLSHLFFPAPAERPQARDRREATAAMVCGDAECASTASSSPVRTTSTASGVARARTNGTPPATG